MCLGRWRIIIVLKLVLVLSAITRRVLYYSPLSLPVLPAPCPIHGCFFRHFLFGFLLSPERPSIYSTTSNTSNTPPSVLIVGFLLKIWCGGSGRRQIRLAGQVTVRYDTPSDQPRRETTNHLQLPRPFSAAQQHLLVRGTPLEVFLFLLPPSFSPTFWLHKNYTTLVNML
jgi:hypothetical protein